MDILAFTLATSLIMADCNQTYQIAEAGRETNIILSDNPSPWAVTAYCGGALAVNSAIFLARPKIKTARADREFKQFRALLWGAVAVFQAVVVSNNFRIGYGVKF